MYMSVDKQNLLTEGERLVVYVIDRSEDLITEWSKVEEDQPFGPVRQKILSMLKFLYSALE